MKIVLGLGTIAVSVFFYNPNNVKYLTNMLILIALLVLAGFLLLLLSENSLRKRAMKLEEDKVESLNRFTASMKR